MAEGLVDELGRPLADHEGLLQALADHSVEFLVAGGLAVILHGYLRLTIDLDIVPCPADPNLERLAAALGSLDASAVDASGDRLPLDLSHPTSLAVGNYFLSTRLGALDLLNGPRPDLKRYRRLEASAVTVTFGGHQVVVVSKSDLIAMKREAGRPKDLRDIAALTEVERNP